MAAGVCSNTVPPFSGLKSLLYFEGRDFMFLWYVHTCLPNHMVSHCGTPQCAFSLPWDVPSQIDEFIQQRPGDVMHLLQCDLSSDNRQVHLIGMRLLKKHRPCFVMCCGRMALWTKWSWVLANLKFSPTSLAKKGGGGVHMCNVLFSLPFMSGSVLPVDCVVGGFCKLLFHF
jgi:hypothetical protein